MRHWALLANRGEFLLSGQMFVLAILAITHSVGKSNFAISAESEFRRQPIGKDSLLCIKTQYGASGVVR